MSAEPPAAPDSRSDLPAPWQNPWGVLARDLWAALVWLRLKAREWIRRNAQGDVRVPSFWPDALRPLFWPSLLAVGVLALVLLLVLLRQVPFAQGPAASWSPPGQPLHSDFDVSPVPEPPMAPAPQLPMAAEQVPAQALAPAPTQERPPDLANVPEPAAPQPVEPNQPAAPDPLLVALRQEDPEDVIHGLERLPAAACVRLSLNSGWSGLPLPLRQRHADDWLQLVRDDGWEFLLLGDTQGRDLGRPAAVGSGMILLDPASL